MTRFERIRPTILGPHDLVGLGVLQHAVLVDAALVGEGVHADDRLVRLHLEAGDRRDQARGLHDLLGDDAVVVAAAGRRAPASPSRPPRAQQLPARSPMPLMVHSIWRAPASTARSELATARPRSLWQWTEMTALSMLGTLFRISRIRSANSSGIGVAHRVRDVDRGGAGLDRALDAAEQEVGLGARGIHAAPLDIVGVAPRAGDAVDHPLVDLARRRAAAGTCECSGEVPMKVWMRRPRGRLPAPRRHGRCRRRRRAPSRRPRSCTSLATSCTAWKSPSDAIGKPASITSTPMASRTSATRSFSSTVIEQPGDCSPSRKVVSKMMTPLGLSGRSSGWYASRAHGRISCCWRWTSVDDSKPLNMARSARAQGQLSRPSRLPSRRRCGRSAAGQPHHADVGRSTQPQIFPHGTISTPLLARSGHTVRCDPRQRDAYPRGAPPL